MVCVLYLCEVVCIIQSDALKSVIFNQLINKYQIDMLQSLKTSKQNYSPKLEA